MATVNEKYTGFIGNLEIGAITVPKLNWELIQYPEENSKLFNKLDLKINDPYVLGENSAIISAVLNIEGKAKPGNETFMTMDIKVNIQVEFDSQFFSKKVLELYQQRNAVFTLMAVLREQVRNATFQMGLPPFIIPTLKIKPLKRESRPQKKKNISDSKQIVSKKPNSKANT